MTLTATLSQLQQAQTAFSVFVALLVALFIAAIYAGYSFGYSQCERERKQIGE